MLFHQAIIELKPRRRGFHLVTGEILAGIPQVARVRVGLLHLFLQHTSASLFLNENADPDVRKDFEHWSSQAMPDGARYLVHQIEGPDDAVGAFEIARVGMGVELLAGREAAGSTIKTDPGMGQKADEHQCVSVEYVASVALEARNVALRRHLDHVIADGDPLLILEEDRLYEVLPHRLGGRPRGQHHQPADGPHHLLQSHLFTFRPERVSSL